MYLNTFENQEEIDTLYLPEDDNQGTWSLDSTNPLIGNKSFKMLTNPNLPPYYFYLFSTLPYNPNPIKIGLTASLKTNIETFGIGFQIVKNGQLAIMFTRLNFTTNEIQTLRVTSPHVWESIGTIPYAFRRDNLIEPFKMSLEISPSTWGYNKFSLHAICKPSGINKWDYPLTIVAEPTSSPQPDKVMIKINPQSKLGIVGEARIDNLEVKEI